jgi:hypothetical protein
LYVSDLENSPRRSSRMREQHVGKKLRSRRGPATH